MKLIVGLGNPGTKYSNNRHNFGFMVVSEFVNKLGESFSKSADLMCDFVKTGDLVVMKPTTFMNNSGQSVSAVVNFYKIDPKELIVIHDDLDLEFGKIRLAFNGTSAGHNGVESAIVGLGTVDFARLRIGVGHPTNPQQNPADFVLEDFSDSEKQKLPEIIAKCQEAVRSWLDDGIEATMNRFN
ncbi:MAG: aminoacyl-tRNA hydrolase [Candidatus Curtissbacteria bacterium]|nr:aminoacyl-tRNA hydrolase [Candidatus Curtissbacteria bacterium]